MAFSKIARAKDAAHMARIKKLKPKQRFKTLSKTDQYILTARVLAEHLNQKRVKSEKHHWAGKHWSTNQIKASYVEHDPVTGLLTDASIKKIKRAASNAVKSVFGKDAMFCLAIEDQDKDGFYIEPHLHIIVVHRFQSGAAKRLKEALQKVAGTTASGSVQSSYLSKFAGSRHHKSRVRDEADFRRTAGYGAKNAQTRIYRSKTVIVHLPAIFEMLKAHYSTPKAS